jgi:hypothetical protein
LKGKVKPRNYLVPLMIEHCKGGAFLNKKKERNKKLCRVFKQRRTYE